MRLPRLLALVPLLVSTAAQADVDQKTVAAVAQVTTGEGHLQKPGDADLKSFQKKVEKCNEAVETALKGGADPGTPVGRTGHTLGEAKTMCPGALRRVTARWIGGSMSNYAGWIKNLAKKNRAKVDGEVALTQADRCRKDVDAALAAGVAPTAEITIAGGDTFALAQAKDKICDGVAAAGQGVIDREVAKVEAKKAPFRKVLTGDKLATWENLWGDSFFGEGGTPLDTPESLRDASTWFIVVSSTDDLGLEHWIVRRYGFSGDKSVGGVSQKTGCCNDPPSSAYH